MTTDKLQTDGVHERPQGPAAGSSVTGEKLYPYDENFARDLKARAVKGIAWSALARMGGQAIRFAVTIVLARVLLPEDFGLLGMAMVAIAFAGVFRDVGLGQAVIQRKELTEQQLSSVFWINLGVGLLLTGLLVVTSPWIASFYGRPDLVWILIFLSLNMAITSSGQIPASLFRRQLNFKTLCLIDVGTAAVSGALALTLAYLGFGVWSLVVRALVGATLRAGALWFLSGWRPRFSISYVAVRPLLAFGLPLLGFSMLNYFNRQFDYLLIGKVLGAESLGYYTMAYAIMLLPLSQISHTICRVTFPMFSSIQKDTERVGIIYLRMVRYIAYVTFPIMAAAVVFAPVGVTLLLGDKWIPAVFPIQVLAGLGALQSLYTTCGALFYPLGRTKTLFRVYLVMTPIIVFSFFAGLPWGVNGVCVSYAAAMCFVTPVVLSVALRLVNKGLRDLVVAVMRPAVLTALTVCGLLAGRFLLTVWWSASLEAELTILGPLACLVYSALVILCAREDVRTLVSCARSGLRGELESVAG